MLTLGGGWHVRVLVFGYVNLSLLVKPQPERETQSQRSSIYITRMYEYCVHFEILYCTIEPFRDRLKGLYVVAGILFLLLLNCSA